MMASDRPAEASPLDHGRWSEGSASTTPRLHGARGDPRRISTEYGLSRAVKTRPIKRRPLANVPFFGRPCGTYLYWTSSRCTRARVAAETSARSLSTWERWPATHRRRPQRFPGWGGGLWSAPLLFGGRSSREQGRPIIITSRNSKYFDARLLSLNRIRPREAASRDACQVHRTNALTRRRQAAYCAVRTAVSSSTEKFLDGPWSAASPR
jgi:hypothetical protein